MGVAVAPAGVVQGGTRTPGRPSTIAQAGSRRRAVLGRRTSGRSRPVCAVTGGGSGAVAAARERAQRWPTRGDGGRARGGVPRRRCYRAAAMFGWGACGRPWSAPSASAQEAATV